MLCPNCEAGEMTLWAGRSVCANCGYAIGPEPTTKTTIIADNLEILK